MKADAPAKRDAAKTMTRGQQLGENTRILKELFSLIRQNKKWWLLPILAVFAVLSFLMVLVGGTSVLPAIYALF